MRTPGLARVAEAFNRMERFKNGDGDLIGADVDFHIAILEATGNDFLAALGGLIQAALKSSFRFTWIGAPPARLAPTTIRRRRDIQTAPQAPADFRP